MYSNAPKATETPPCLLCESRDPGRIVGQKGRFGMDVQNVVCERCGLVFQTPRPDRAAMSEYYSGAYRQHYGDVKYPSAQGPVVWASPDTRGRSKRGITLRL